MRPTLIFILLLSIQLAQGQKIDSTTDKTQQELFDYYTYKQKTQKKAAWITLGVGSALTIGGSILIYDDLYGANGSIGAVMFLIGVPTTLVSIPLFIASGKNKRKANLALKGESISLKYNPNSNTNSVSLSLTVQLGK